MFKTAWKLTRISNHEYNLSEHCLLRFEKFQKLLEGRHAILKKKNTFHRFENVIVDIPEEESELLSGLGSLMLLGYNISPTTQNCLDYLSKSRRIMKTESLLIRVEVFYNLAQSARKR